MTNRSTRRELEIADHLWECLTRIAEDKGTDPQTVLNQAIFDLARRFNFLTPVAVVKGKAQPGAASPAAREPAPNGGPPREMAKKSPGPAAVASLPPKSAAPSAQALFVVNGSGDMTKVEKDQFVIGRSRACDLVISSSKVSRRHCSVVRENGDFFIEDMGSPNGVWREGVKITKEKIRDGDEFMISDEVIKFVFRSSGARK